MRTLLLLSISVSALAQSLVGITGGGSAAPPTPPTYASSDSGRTDQIAGNKFPFAAISVAAGDIVYAIVGSRTKTDCATIASVSATASGSPSGDTYAQIPASTIATGTSFVCGISFKTFTTVTDATYVITFQGDGSSPAVMPYAVAVFHPGSLTTLDTTCIGHTDGATSVSCGTALTTAETNALAITGAIAYDPSTAPAANSPYTLASWSNVTGAASAYVAYKIISASGTYTPGFTLVGLGDPVVIIGAIFK